MKTTPKKSGQSVIEFALTLPLVLLLIFVFLDLGRAVYYYAAVTNAVREGARYAIVHKRNSDVDAIIRSKVANYSVAVDIEEDTVSIQYGGIDDMYIIIGASYEFNPITPFLERIMGTGNTITIHSSSSMLLAPIAQ